MSLVAPIQMDQYIQYANRTVNDKADYASISKVSRIQLNGRHIEEDRKEETRKFAHILEKIKRKPVKKVPSAVTGKGFVVHEII